MDTNLKKYHQAFLLFTIAQLFMTLGLLDYAGTIKALSDWMFLFSIFQFVAFILMIIASTKLRDFNKNYFYAFLSAVICLFIALLASVSKESTEDFTVAWGRGLSVSSDILLCIVYAYFFLGSKDHFIETGLERNVKRSKLGFIFVISMTILINLMAFIGSFNFVKTNFIAVMIFRYGGLLAKFLMYLFMFIVLVLMMSTMKKDSKKEEVNHE